MSNSVYGCLNHLNGCEQYKVIKCNPYMYIVSETVTEIIEIDRKTHTQTAAIHLTTFEKLCITFASIQNVVRRRY